MISIIIPVYNCEKHLNQCIESVLNQEFHDIECILINDGSTDNSGYICDEWVKRDRRIRVYHQNNLGVSKTRNRGITLAKGEYIYFIDADDFIINDRIFFAVNEKHDMYIGSYAIGEMKPQRIYTHSSYEDNLPIAYLNNSLKTCIGGFIVKTQILKIYDITFPEDIKYGEDQIFILKSIIQSEKIKVINEPLCLYRTNLSSAMYRITLRRFDVVIALLALAKYLSKIDSHLSKMIYMRYALHALWETTTGLFRFGMDIKMVKKYFESNQEIRDYLFDLSHNRKINKAGKLLNHLYRLKAEVLFDKYIYMFRCNASKIKKLILR